MALHAFNNSIALGNNAGWSAGDVVLVMFGAFAAISAIVWLALSAVRRPLVVGAQ
jgi:hypothetical protein